MQTIHNNKIINFNYNDLVLTLKNTHHLSQLLGTNRSVDVTIYVAKNYYILHFDHSVKVHEVAQQSTNLLCDALLSYFEGKYISIDLQEVFKSLKLSKIEEL